MHTGHLTQFAKHYRGTCPLERTCDSGNRTHLSFQNCFPSNFLEVK